MDRVDNKLTAVADEIRELSGATDKLGLDDMALNVREGNEEINAQKALIEQAMSALEDKVSPALYEQGYKDGLAARTYENWTITLTDGSTVEKEVALL